MINSTPKIDFRKLLRDIRGEFVSTPMSGLDRHGALFRGFFNT